MAKRRKYKTNLKKKVLEERGFQEKQSELKEKYDIADEEIVVVEKSNTLKFLIRSLASLIRITATIVLITLAFIGLVAIVYPEPRNELLQIWEMILGQLKMCLNF